MMEGRSLEQIRPDEIEQLLQQRDKRNREPKKIYRGSHRGEIKISKAKYQEEHAEELKVQKREWNEAKKGHVKIVAMVMVMVTFLATVVETLFLAA